MNTPFRIPTRDANDADHLALMLLVGGIFSFTKSDIAEIVQLPWLVLGLISVVTAPLLWMRVPFAKWGGVLVSLIIGSIPLLRIPDQGFDYKDGLIVVAFLVITYWFYIIDYNHKFPEQE